MRILGIETSCDETAAAVVDGEGRVHSNVISSQVPIHARYGGVVPELASRNHLMSMIPVIRQALEEAGTDLDGLDRIAVTRGPGLIGALMVGVQAAKSLARTRDLPLIPVHHTEAHITAVFLEGGDLAPAPPEFPYVALAVSGGHSSIYGVLGVGRYRRLGTTLDDAAGTRHALRCPGACAGRATWTSASPVSRPRPGPCSRASASPTTQPGRTSRRASRRPWWTPW